MVIGIGGFILVSAILCGLLVGIGTAQTNDSGTNASFGAEVSSFMQASDAETQAEVDDETFENRLNRTTDPQERRALIEQRQDRLEERNQGLRAQRDTLNESKADVRNRALATRIVVGSAGLERSVNGTERAATAVGMDTERLNALRSSARELRGPDVAEMARGAAGPPGVAPAGPLGNGNGAGGPTDGPPESPGNEEQPDEPGSNDAREADRPESASDNDGEERGGPPEDSEGSDAPGQNNGNDGDDRGSGNDGGDGEGADEGEGNGSSGSENRNESAENGSEGSE